MIVVIDAYWWQPTRPLKTPVGEIVNHGGAWLRLLARTRRMCNFGDEVNSTLLPLLTGDTVRWVPMRRADVVSVGSLMNEYCRSGATAWVLGSGVRVPEALPEQPLTDHQRSRIRGVRGRLSAKALGLPDHLVIGDPG